MNLDDLTSPQQQVGWWAPESAQNESPTTAHTTQLSTHTHHAHWLRLMMIVLLSLLWIWWTYFFVQTLYPLEVQAARDYLISFIDIDADTHDSSEEKLWLTTPETENKNKIDTIDTPTNTHSTITVDTPIAASIRSQEELELASYLWWVWWWVVEETENEPLPHENILTVQEFVHSSAQERIAADRENSVDQTAMGTLEDLQWAFADDTVDVNEQYTRQLTRRLTDSLLAHDKAKQAGDKKTTTITSVLQRKINAVQDQLADESPIDTLVINHQMDEIETLLATIAIN